MSEIDELSWTNELSVGEKVKSFAKLAVSKQGVPYGIFSRLILAPIATFIIIYYFFELRISVCTQSNEPILSQGVSLSAL